MIVDDLGDGNLSVPNGGSGTDTTKTRAGRSPLLGYLRSLLAVQNGDRPKLAWMSHSLRKPRASAAEQYTGQALTRAVARAKVGRGELIPRQSAHAFRRIFAAISLSEAGSDLLALSRAMGHARASITCDQYGHLAPEGLASLMAKSDELVRKPA